MRFVALSSGCHDYDYYLIYGIGPQKIITMQIQKARNPQHCLQLLIRLLIKLCMLAARHFETTEGAS